MLVSSSVLHRQWVGPVERPGASTVFVRHTGRAVRKSWPPYKHKEDCDDGLCSGEDKKYCTFKTCMIMVGRGSLLWVNGNVAASNVSTVERTCWQHRSLHMWRTSMASSTHGF